MSRLALFIPLLQGGGAERITLELARGIAAAGHEVDLVLCRREGELASEPLPGVRVVELGARGAGAAVLPLARYLRERRPEALLSAMTHANLAALLAKRLARTGTRVVVAEHNATGERLARARGAREHAVFRAAAAAYLRWADGIVAVSEGVARDLAGSLGVPRERIEVVYNPIVTDRVLRAAAEPVSGPFLDAGPAPFVAVGRLAPQKGFDLLLSAFALVRASRPARLVVLGEGPERGALEGLARALGVAEHVAMPGFVPNPHAWMARAAAVVLSSRWEGLPTVVVEALAAGAPVAAFDCPFGPREILEVGPVGHLAAPEDPAALAEAMIRASEEGRSPEQVARRRRRAADFTSEAAVRRYLDLLLGPAPRPAVDSRDSTQI